MLGAIAGFATGGARAAEEIDFARDVLPILSDSCFHCHGPDEKRREAELRLDTQPGILAERNGKRIVSPGSSAASELMRRIASPDDAERMPPPDSNRRLTAVQIETLRRWIDAGAAWGKHWALIPPRRPALPAVQDPAWPRNAIDRFILARLEREGLKPSAEADPSTLIRRITLDLTGLPPTPQEVDEFRNSALRTPHSALDSLVDRLLASPRYGEHMAWQWLDAARYADTNGYQGDSTRTMWPWRDWAVAAINSNVPFDRFTLEQLAGDLLPAATLEQKLATGFHRNHMINGEGGRIPEESRVDYVVDRVDTTATVWLGLTVGCARCHDHKYDPLPQRDYYRLYAYFNNVNETGGERSGQAKPALAVPSSEQAARLATLAKQVKDLAAEVEQAEKQQIAEEPLAELKKRLEQARKAQETFDKSIPRVMIMEDLAKPRATHILVRGAYDKYGDAVQAGTPASLHPLPPQASADRLGLAQWLIDPANPLTARVTVNRAWQTLFGTGLVKTSEDFGVQGEKPSHPELLDWLAVEFIKPRPLVAGGEENAWDLKALHRAIVTSAAYRQASRVTPELLERDPENRLLARGPRFRLPSSVLRDQALAVSGLLVERLGGPPVMPYQPEGVWEEATFGKIKYQEGSGNDLYRRTLYTFWRRIVGPTMLFDVGARQVCTVRQLRTSSPLHALTLLNDVTFVEAARAMAQRVLTLPLTDSAGRIEAAFRLATCRTPRPAEQTILEARLTQLRQQYAADPEAARKLLTSGESKRDEQLDAIEHAAFSSLCLLILNLDEVQTKE